MRILFVYTNVNGFHTDTYSFGLASLISCMNGLGYEVKSVIVSEKREYAHVYDAVKKFDPRVVGFSSVSSQFLVVKEIAAEVKKLTPQIITVCGGIHPTIFPESLFEIPSLDGAFIGESELAFADFVSLVERNESYWECNNFAYVKDGRLIRNPLKPLVRDLDQLPYPNKTIYPYEETIRATGYAPFLFSRGCPFRCTYCSNHAIAKLYNMRKNFPRYRSPRSSVREIEETLDAFPLIKIVGIVDDIFGLNRKWRMEFLRLYKERVKRKFFCLLRVDVVDEGFIKQLSAAGCKRISFGVESGNAYVRNVIMKRNLDEESIIRAFGMAHSYGIETNAINIIGVPGETPEMIWDTIRLNRKVRPTISCVNIFYPYKGTVLGNECFEKGLVNEAEYGNFTLERRRTILKFPDEYRKKLDYFYKNWDVLVFPYSLKKRLLRLFSGTPVWGFLRKTKRFAVQIRDMLEAFIGG